MTEPRVMTCADAGYFHFLPFFEANVERKFGKLPLIYDLGLTEAQRTSLRSEVRRVPVPEDFAGTAHGFVRATHKPACVADALDASPGGVLCADADLLFVGPVTRADVGEADVAVTPRTARERRPDYLAKGAINTGLVYFAVTAPARSLVAGWAEACAIGDRGDQVALSDLLVDFDLLGPLGPATRGGMTVLKLDARVFNDTRLKTGRVLHFKNAGRDPRVVAKLERFRRLEERHPRALATYVAARRALRV